MRVEPVQKAPTAVKPMMPPPAPMPMQMPMQMQMPMPMPIAMPMPLPMPMHKPVHHYPQAYGLYCCPVPQKPMHHAYHHPANHHYQHGYHEHPGCCMHGKQYGGHDDWLLRRK